MNELIELLPLPSVLLNWPHPTNHVAIRDYARACVAHAATAKDAEIGALRAEVERMTRCLATANANHEQFERQWYLERDRAERLAEALRDARDYVTTALREEREKFAGHEDCSDIPGIEADLHKIDSALNPTDAQENDDA